MSFLNATALSRSLKRKPPVWRPEACQRAGAAELALRNLSSNAGFSDVTRLVLRMEAHLAEESRALFEGDVLEDGTKIRLFVAEDGKSSIVCEREERH